MSKPLDVTQTYIAHCAEIRRLSAHSIRAYEADINQFKTIIGHDRLTASRAVDALRRVAENPRYKVSTIKRKIAVVKGFLKFADEELADEVRRLWKVTLRSPKHLPKALPRQHLKLLLRSSKTTGSADTHLALSLLAATGLRVSELCALRLTDIDPKTGNIRVIGKGARERVVVVVNDRVRSALIKHMCVSAWNKDPVFGVIGIQLGPRS